MADIIRRYTVQGMAAIAEWLKTLLESRKLTQSRLTELIGVNPRAYNRWECGNFVPRLDTIIKIADALNVSLGELTGRSQTIQGPAVHNPMLRTLLKEVYRWPDEDQQALVILMDSLVNKRSQMSNLMAA